MRKKHRFSLSMAIATLFMFLVVAFFALPRYLGDMAYPLKYADDIKSQASTNNIRPELLAGLILAESSFNERSVSSAGAMGIVQMMPGTARAVARRHDLPTSFNLLDPHIAIQLGALHIRELEDMYASLGPDNQEKAMLVAYNAGSGVADYWIKNGMNDKYLSYGVKNYVKKIRRYADVYKQMYANELGIENEVAFAEAAGALRAEQNKAPVTTFWIDLFARTINLKL